MNLLSIVFAAFMMILLIILLLTKKEVTRQNVLLIASWLFYAYADIRFLSVLLFQTITAYGTARSFTGRNRQAGKKILAAGIVLELGVLALFKYIPRGGYSKFDIVMPLGLSFYTFQAVSYIVDTYKGAIPADSSFKKTALYIGFFPQITSGPIVKAHDFLGQLEADHPVRMQNVAAGAQIFLMGIVKKTVIADRLGRAVDAVYAAPGIYSGMSLLLTTVAYSMQLYCDFSGYSDMAVGIAKCLGYDLGRNFNMPYIARNPADFWRRWHISLSDWFKEYVYFPLGGSRKGLCRACLNIFIVMLLSGIWHGAGWTFVCWGLYHGIGSVAHKLFARLVDRRNWHVKSDFGKKAGGIISIIFTFIFVNTGWVMFRADGIGTAWTVMVRILTMAEGVRYIYVFTIIFAVMFVACCIYVLVWKKGEASYVLLDCNKFSSWFLLWTVILLTLAFFYPGDTAFIYGGF